MIAAMNGENFENRDRGRVAPSRTAAIGGTRVARMAGKIPARTRDEGSCDQADDDRACPEDRPCLREIEPEGGEDGVQALGETEAEEQPDDRGDEADHERLEDHRAEDLPPRRTDRPQRRELADSLGDRDRQRIEDDEGADEECDAAEREEEVPDELREPLDVLGLILCLLVAGLHFRAGGEDGIDLVDELLRRDTLLAGDLDAVELAHLVEQPLSFGNRERRDRGTPDRVDRAVLRDAGDRELLRRALRDHADRCHRPRSRSCRPFLRRSPPRAALTASCPR